MQSLQDSLTLNHCKQNPLLFNNLSQIFLENIPYTRIISLWTFCDYFDLLLFLLVWLYYFKFFIYLLNLILIFNAFVSMLLYYCKLSKVTQNSYDNMLNKYINKICWVNLTQESLNPSINLIFLMYMSEMQTCKTYLSH